MTSPSASAAAHQHELDAPFREHYVEEYPHEVWYFLGAFLGVVALCQWGSVIVRKVGARFRLTSAMNTYRAIAFRTTINFGGSYYLNGAEVFCTIGYIVALFTWELVNTTNVAGEHFAPAYMSSRAGAIATSQFPLLVALGSKNNLISLITGVSYEKLNYIHRMCARVCFVMLWLHGGLKMTRAAGRWNEIFVRAGLLAIVALSILLVLSLRPIRQQAYEVFFYAHFFLVLIFLVGGYYHTRPYGSYPFILAALGLWAFDRLIRFIRLIAYNVPSPFSAHSISKYSPLDARVTLLTPQLIRLSIRRPPHFRWAPGQTAYLIMPFVSRLPWEAHPFTIASHDSPLGVNSSPASSMEKIHEDEHVEGDTWKELVFLINVRGGLTKRLERIAMRNEHTKVLVDGPYGSNPDVGGFDRVVLVACGSGVSYTLPLLIDAVERSRRSEGVCKKVSFIWAIRDSNHISWISDALANLPTGLDIELDIRIFVTGSSREAVFVKHDLESHATITSSKLKMTPPNARVDAGRPNLQMLLDGATEEAPSGSRLGVFVCGSQSIAQGVKRILRSPKGSASVLLHVESFGFA